MIVSLLFASAALLIPHAAHAQVTALSDVGDDLGSFSKDMLGALSATTAIGTAWSTSYIGPLIDHPSHWGLGLTLGVTTLRLPHLEPLAQILMGTDINRNFADKKIIPAYVIDGRLGGFRNIPFDLGVKFGYLPSIPIMKDDISYQYMQWGVDLRFAVRRDWGRGPALNVGLEVDGANGSLTRDGQAEIDRVRGASSVSFKYDAIFIQGKAAISKTFFMPNVTIFSELKLGYGFGKAGYGFSGDDLEIDVGTDEWWYVGDFGKPERKQYAADLAAIQGDGYFEFGDTSFSSYVKSRSIVINSINGFSFNFYNDIYLQFAVIMDFAHLEYGASLTFRYQP